MKIEHIYIRAQDPGGTWGSFSLQELFDSGQGAVALAWLIERLIGLIEEGRLTKGMFERAVDLLPTSDYAARREDVKEEGA